MSFHKNPKYQIPELIEALKSHGLEHDTPSQLADAFRTGWMDARVTAAPQEGEWHTEFYRMLREYPDFDEPGPFSTALDEAIAGRRPTLLGTIDSLAAGRMPLAAAPLPPASALPDTGNVGAEERLAEAMKNPGVIALGEVLTNAALPQPRGVVPLTKEQALAISAPIFSGGNRHPRAELELVRAVEAHHGIKEGS